MIFTIIGLSTLSLAGFQICRLISSALNAELNLWQSRGRIFSRGSITHTVAELCPHLP